MLNSSRTYSQKVCFDLCFNMNYRENSKCNCTPNLEEVLEKCYANEEYYTSLWNCTRTYRSVFSRKYFDKCFEYCPLECDSVTYTLTTNSLIFPPTGNISLRDRASWFDSLYDKYEDVHKSFYSFYIFCEDLKYTIITQKEKMAMADLASNIGGIIGVFMGSSFLSLIEFLQLFIEVFYILRN